MGKLINCTALYNVWDRDRARTNGSKNWSSVWKRRNQEKARTKMCWWADNRVRRERPINRATSLDATSFAKLSFSFSLWSRRCCVGPKCIHLARQIDQAEENKVKTAKKREKRQHKQMSASVVHAHIWRISTFLFSFTAIL